MNPLFCLPYAILMGFPFGRMFFLQEQSSVGGPVPATATVKQFVATRGYVPTWGH